MSRTRLFGEVQRAYLLARESLRTGETAAEVVDRAREEGAVSRRRFLGFTAAGVAALALDGAARPVHAARRAGDDGPVLVVGAGIAGLTAAYRLRQNGVAVRVLEAQNRVGGRMFSLRGHFAGEQVAELGGELIDSGHRSIRRLADELGIALDDLDEYAPGAARDVWFFGGQRRSDAEVVEAFRPVVGAIQRDLATLSADDVTADEPACGEALDRTPLSAWMDRNVGRSWFRDLLEVAYVTENGQELDRQSALNLLLMLDGERAGRDFRVFGDSDEQYHVRGGNDRITTALAGRLEGAVETGTVLEAVSRRADGTLVCAFQRGAGRMQVAAKQVILAIPFTLLRSVHLDDSLGLPAIKRRAIGELTYGTNAKLMVGFTGRPWETRHQTIGSTFTDLPYQASWETSRQQNGAAGILTNFTGGRHGVELGQGTPAEQAARFVAQLERVYPGVGAYRSPVAPERFHWPTFPWTLGSYSTYAPGQYTTLRGVEGTSECCGTLHFAGEHCSLEAQGFMEGGCETGEAAAAAVLFALRAEPKRPCAETATALAA